MPWDWTAQSDAAVLTPNFGCPPQGNRLGIPVTASPLSPAELEVPHYLNAHYWWAYIHPTAVHVFERQWLVNVILWGNYARLRDAVMAEIGDTLPGRTLQVAWLTKRIQEFYWSAKATPELGPSENDGGIGQCHTPLLLFETNNICGEVCCFRSR